MTTLDRRPALEAVSTGRGLEALRPEWDDLLADADGASIFATHAWVDAWHRTAGAAEELLVLTAREPERGLLLGVAPFSVATRRAGPFRIRVLRMAGTTGAAGDHLDLVVRHGHPHVAAELWRFARQRRSWDLVDLDGLRPGSHLGRVMLRRRGDREAHVTRTACPVLHLPGTWEEYEASLGRNHRQNLRRYARKLDREAGGPVVERMVVAPDEVEETVAGLARMHQQVRTARGDRGSFADPAMVDFHTRVALRFLEAGRLRLHRLDVDGRMAAAISCFRHDETVSFYTTGYDPALSSYGPGRRIMAAAIRSAIDEGARRFDFLRGDEPYKRTWGAADAWDDRVRMPAGARGRAIDLGLSAIRAVRATVRRSGAR